MIINGSFDTKHRTLDFRGNPVDMYYVSSLVKENLIAFMVDGIIEAKGKTFKDCINNGDVLELDDKKMQEYLVLSGCTLITYLDKAYIIETRLYPARSVDEPETERSVRGAKDGFTENVLTCAGLIRRRIKTTDLVLEIQQIGGSNKMDVCLCYLKNEVNKELLINLNKRLQGIENNDLVMSDRALEEIIIQQGYNPYPLVRYSERPDVVSTHILHGHIALICDTSSSVMMIPTTIFELLEHVEEYRQNPLVGSGIRLLRYFAVLLSVYLVPIWLAIIVNSDAYDVFIIQILILEVAVEILRLATVHIPTSISNAMGVIAAILLGQFAIEIGVFSPEVLLFGAVGNICGFATPNYELSLTNKYIKFGMILSLALFSWPGIFLYNVVLIIYLGRLNLFGYHFLYPLYPFDFTKLWQHFVRKKKIRK